MDWLRRLFAGSRAGAPKAPPPTPLATVEDLRALVRRCGYGEAENAIVALAEPVFHIIAGPPAPDAPLGATRLGGAPDLPRNASWPSDRAGRTMDFLGQFDLADVRARTGSDQLPPTGLLSLFVGEIAGETQAVEVLTLFTPSGASLARRAQATGTNRDSGAGPLKPVSIAAFQAGLSLSGGDLERLDLEARFPDGDIWMLEEGLAARPKGAIGEWLGRRFDDSGEDQRQVAHSRRIGRPELARYAFIESWAQWEELKTVRSRLRNGTVHRPWTGEGDKPVRWLLDNRAAFDAGVASLRLLLRIDSNREMGLWINDYDPIYVFVDDERLARGDFSELHATVTQG